MKLELALAVVALGAASCTDETSYLLRVRFSDCSIAAAEVAELVFIIENADGSAIEGLQEVTREEDGVEVSGDDVDADGLLESVLRTTRAHHDIRDGFAVRLVGEPNGREFVVTVLAADDEGRQIGVLDGEPRAFRFHRDEEHSVDLPIRCLCLGMTGCGGTCEGVGDTDCRPPQDHETYCHDGLDNDADPLRDCADNECYRLGPCAECDVELCEGKRDDDCDGDTDCGDDDCLDKPICDASLPEDCDNGGDDDRDSKTDCLDPDCRQDDACNGPCTPRNEICDNRRDDDCDDLTDCRDDDCGAPPGETACDDGFDDDCDDRTDCADPDCYGECGCKREADEERLVPDGCHDGLDEDCDGAFDCDDPDCVGAVPEICDNTVDDDCDGDNNCADSDCPGGTAKEICDDLFDNDCDLIFDCDDPACLTPGVELLSGCQDTLDNDCDGKADCQDTDCSELPICSGTSF